MLTIRALYDGYLDDLRKSMDEINLPNLQFSDVLRSEIKNPLPLLYAESLETSEQTENRLIEIYRVEFYEWLGDILIKSSRDDFDKLLKIKLRESNSKRAKHAADAKHSKPGGSREKHDLIRKIWASGKYSSRDICAEQECGALDMSYSAARKALRKTPSPT